MWTGSGAEPPRERESAGGNDKLVVGSGVDPTLLDAGWGDFRRIPSGWNPEERDFADPKFRVGLV